MFITEELVKTKHDLLMFAIKKLEKGSIWIMEGKIYAKANGRKIILKNEDDGLNIISS